MSDERSNDRPSARQVRAYLRPVCAVAPMPRVGLLPGERMRLAGYLFKEGDELVDAVVRALRHNRELFPDVPTDPQQIADHKEQAQAYKQIHAALSMLAERAYDNYLIEQAAAVQGAMDVVRQVRADDVRPFAQGDPQGRKDALRRAEAILARRIERQKRAHKRRLAKEAEPPPPRPAPSTVAAKQAHKAYRDAVIDGYLEAKRRARAAEETSTVPDVPVPVPVPGVGPADADVRPGGPAPGAGRRALYRSGIVQEE